MTDELARLDAVALSDLIGRRELSPRELVESTIERIERLDPHVNAVIHRSFDAALAAADSPDLPDGPFRGVPMLLKDLWPSSAGEPMHLGVQGMKAAGYRHPSDANITVRYRQAGFIITGRTNTPELGQVATTEPWAYGATRNPWNLDHGAGGSSGGAAAAVAAGMVPMANASDGGGSIRIPAALCGLVGLKPSRGRISMGPMQDEWGVSVQHIVSHTVRDTAAVLDVSAGPFPGDGVIAPAPRRRYADEVGADPGRLRIGVLLDSGRVPVDAECVAAARATAATLEGLGHHVEEAWPDALDDTADLGRSFGVAWGASCAASVARLGQLIGRPLGEDDVEPGTWITVQRANAVTAAELTIALGVQHAFRRRMAGWWASGFDLLLTPTTARPAPRLGELAATADEPFKGQLNSMPYAVFTSVFNVTGQPAITVPAGFTAGGLPVGVQLAGAYGAEDVLIRVAAQLEQAAPWADRRAPIHP